MLLKEIGWTLLFAIALCKESKCWYDRHTNAVGTKAAEIKGNVATAVTMIVKLGVNFSIQIFYN